MVCDRCTGWGVQDNNMSILLRNMSRKFQTPHPRYFVGIEEAHKVLAQSHKKIDEVIEDFVLVCRKISIGLGVVLPQVIDLTEQVLNDLKDIVTGKFKGQNATRLIKAMNGDPRAIIIPRLEYNRFENRREFIYYNQDYNTIFRYRPYASPCDFHREVSPVLVEKRTARLIA